MTSIKNKSSRKTIERQPCSECQSLYINQRTSEEETTIYDKYRKMLQDERTQFQKIIQITQVSDGQQESQNIITPSKVSQNQRQPIVQEYILKLASKMRMSNMTQHLAVKIYDFVTITQIEEPFMKSGKNLPGNLKLLAASCLLLSSKFNDVQRVYPAELIHNVKGWGVTEFEILKSGQIEEYILNVIQFDLMFLTPTDFISFFTEQWELVKPSVLCQHGKKNGEISLFMSDLSTFQKKIKLQANELSKHVVSYLGHSISVKYLPSQIAAVCLYLSQKTVLKSERANYKGQIANDVIDALQKYLDETMRIIGYDSKSPSNGFSQLIKEIKANPSLSQIVDLKVRQESIKKTEIKQKIEIQKQQKLSGISKANDTKFEKMLKKAFNLEKGSEIYPFYAPTKIEKNLNVTMNFFNYQYRNNENPCSLELCSSKILPTIESLTVKDLHDNWHQNIDPITTKVTDIRKQDKKLKVQKNQDQENKAPSLDLTFRDSTQVQSEGIVPYKSQNFRENTLQEFHIKPSQIVLQISESEQQFAQNSSMEPNNLSPSFVQEISEQQFLSQIQSKAELDQHWASLYENLHEERLANNHKPHQREVLQEKTMNENMPIKLIQPPQDNILKENSSKNSIEACQQQNMPRYQQQQPQKPVSNIIANYRPLRQPKKKQGMLAQAAQNVFAQRHMPPPQEMQNPKMI